MSIAVLEPVGVAVLDVECQEAVPCQEYSAEMWFSAVPREIEQAKALCAPCPLKSDCLAGALERAEPWGVWGGQLLEAGAVLAVKRGPGRPRKNQS